MNISSNSYVIWTGRTPFYGGVTITFRSLNANINSTTAKAKITKYGKYGSSIYVKMNVSSEPGYDKGSVYLNQTLLKELTGNNAVWPDSGSYNAHLQNGDYLILNYYKDFSEHHYNDETTWTLKF